MVVSFNQVVELLRSLDIEDLIAAGAPLDEYDGEAKDIVRELTILPVHQTTTDQIIQIISEVWQKSFHLNSDDIAKRMPQFIAFSQKIINNKL